MRKIDTASWNTRRYVFTFLLVICRFLSSAQDNSEKARVDLFMKRFDLKMDTVSWLCRYDDIAWWTSDSVLASPKDEQDKLGPEWFCFQENNIWHAVYGKFQGGKFEMVYHYEVNMEQKIKRVFTVVDTVMAHSYSRALINSKKFVNDYPDSIKVRFNQYIRTNKDNTISVWLLPAFTTNGIAVYGGEFYYLFDPTGNNLISKSEYSQGYKGFKPDAKKEIWLNYEDRDEPTLGSLFFIWYYRKYFDRIVVDAKKFKSTLFHDSEKGYYWVHAVKE